MDERSTPNRLPERDTAAPVLVLSPHFDDAVFNHWSLLSDPGIDVVVANVFGGLPPAGVCAIGDRERGVRDGAQYVAMRRSEDLEALRLVRRSPRNLDLVEFRYRFRQLRIPGWLARGLGRPGVTVVNPPWRRDQPTIRAEVRSRIDALAERWSMICAPVGIGGHPDHHVVRDVAIGLGRDTGIPVRLYADLPYACANGWPAWMRGSSTRSATPVDLEWTRTARLPASVELPPWHDANVVTLDAKSAAHKRRAVATYETQFDDLNACFRGRMADPDTWTREAFWNVPS